MASYKVKHCDRHIAKRFTSVVDILYVISRSIIMCNIYVNYNWKPNKYFLFRLVRRPVKTCSVVILQCIAEVFLLWCKELVESVLQRRFTWTMANDDNKKALDAAKKKRAAAKLWLTRSVNAVEALRNQLVGSVEQEIEEIDYTDALENLNKRLESWEEAQSQMECVIDNVQDLEADIEVAADFLEMVLRRKRSLIKAWRSAGTSAATESQR